MDIERRIQIRKKERQAQIAWRILGFLMILIGIWFVASWAQVVHYGDLYYMTGEVKEYPWWNFFEVMDKIKEVLFK